jgi:hypothetical protein
VIDANVLHLLNLLIILPLAITMWRSASRLGPGSIILRALLLYLMGAHFGKAALLTYAEWEPAVDAGILTRDLTESEDRLAAMLILFYSVGVMAACVSVMGLMRKTPPAPSTHTDEDGARGLKVVLWGLAVLLPYKFFINHIMRWGVPAHVPEHTIPLITGGSVYLVRDAVMCLCAAALFQSFVVLSPSPRHRPLRRLAVAAALVYAGIDLAMGSKFGMLGIVFVSASLASRAFMRQDRRGRMRTIGLSLLVLLFLMPAYQIANVLRFIPLDKGLDLLAVYDKLSDKVDIDVVKIIFAMAGRVTGAEGVAAAVVLDGRLSPHFIDIFASSDFANQYTFALTGLDAENVAFGATLAGTYSLICRADVACVCGVSYIVTFLLMGLLCLVVARLPCRPAVRFGIASSLALIAVHSQLASGGIVTIAQRILVILVAGWSIDRLMDLRAERAQPHPALP